MATQIAIKDSLPSSWFYDSVERGKTEIFTEMVSLTPALAKQLLGNNPNNRSLKQGKLYQFISDIKEGNWQANGETIIISQDGRLNDGQHRCEAVIRADMAIPVLMVFGVTRQSRATVDQGVARTTADILSMDGVTNAATVSAALRMLLAWEAVDQQSIAQARRISTMQVRDRLAKDSSIVEEVSYCNARRVGFINASTAAFCHHVFARVHKDQANAFMKAILEGEGLQRGDPAHTVRNRLISGVRFTREQIVEIMFRGFLAVRESRELQRVYPTGNLPKIS